WQGSLLAGSSWKIYSADPETTTDPLVEPYPVLPYSSGVGPVAGALSGVFIIEDMLPGTYWLVEVKAPERYSLLADPIGFTLTMGPTGPSIQLLTPGSTATVPTTTGTIPLSYGI